MKIIVTNGSPKNDARKVTSMAMEPFFVLVIEGHRNHVLWRRVY